MDAFVDVDLSLFGLFGAGPEALSAGRPADAALTQEADAVLLELKSAEAAAGAEDLRLLLNEMTREMRAQFLAFRALRAEAERQAAEGDEAAQKLARADLKAATDAMSLIVRTLEKVDSLQRQLSRDRAEEAERRAEETGFEEALRDVRQLIEARATELFRRWQMEGEHNEHGTSRPVDGGHGAAGAGPPIAGGAEGIDVSEDAA
ncbi:hypothetical protein [Rhizobium sp. CSW-27]|uniref:hypothetical protein n=1 Tax=Rhizobium sp. CSW-27 TaxID=2839985 RepID=UPI001C011BE4|nr:hypothetical protein [Rhizobium sp. CSW-27]MBT9368605.1 hypothetical protein [Rhizobium sp. CSW-27]